MLLWPVSSELLKHAGNEELRVYRRVSVYNTLTVLLKSLDVLARCLYYCVSGQQMNAFCKIEEQIFNSLLKRLTCILIWLGRQ